MKPGRIRSLRRRLGLTQAQFAEALGVAPNTVARWERGESSPSRPSLFRLRGLADGSILVPGESFTKEELIRRLAKALDLVPDVEYAIGGAEAMAAHGYARHTEDVDVFVHQDHLNRLMAALRAVGLETVSVFEPFHYAARLPGDRSFERRIDVLSPEGEPGLSGIEYAVEAERYGRRWRVFPPRLLAVAKFYAFRDSGDPRHQFDLLAMYRRGIFDARQAREVVAYLGDEEDLTVYDAVLGSSPAGRSIKRKRRLRRLPPPG